MAIATIGKVLGKAGLAYLKKNKSKIKKELDSPESKQKIQEIMDKAKKGLGKKMLTGGQAKIAAKAPPPNKIDEKDFAVLRKEKAKGRGMGLQDEKVQPGKVQKAALGLMFMKKAKDKGAKGAEFLSPLAMLKRISGKKAGGVMKANKGKMASDRDRRQKELIKKQNPISEYDRKGKLKYTAAKMGKSIKADPTKTITDKGQFVKRRKQLGGGRSKLPGRIGTALGAVSMLVPAAYAAAKQYKDYKSAKNRDEAKVKKMGGGMIGPSQRPDIQKVLWSRREGSTR